MFLFLKEEMLLVSVYLQWILEFAIEISVGIAVVAILYCNSFDDLSFEQFLVEFSLYGRSLRDFSKITLRKQFLYKFD